MGAARRLNLLLAVAILALGMRLAVVGQISQAPFAGLRLGDAQAYHEWALRIAGGDWVGADVFYQAPLYPYFLSLVYTVLGDGTAMVRFVQAALGAGSCVLLGAAGMALFGELGIVAGLLLAIYPPAIFFDALLEKSSIVMFLTAALLYLLASGRTMRASFLIGVTLGALTLARENALLLLVPIVAWLASLRGSALQDPTASQRSRWSQVAVCLAGCALVLLPVATRNYAVGGGFHLTTSQFGPNFYIGNHAGARGLYEALVPGHGEATDERADAIRLAQDAAGRPLNAREVSSFWASRAFTFIRSQPLEWLGQLARKLALTFANGEVADTESQEVYAEWSSLLRAMSPLGFGVIIGLAACGLVMTAREYRRLWWLYAIAATYTASVVLFFVFARYRLPIVLVLMILAAGGAAAWRDRSARSRRPLAIAALVATLWLSYLPRTDASSDRITHYVNIGNQLLKESRRWDDASAFYAKALKESPQSPAGHYGLGALMVLKRQFTDALVHYQRAVDGWPDNADLRIDYAMALAGAGDHDSATDQLYAASLLRVDAKTLAQAREVVRRLRPSEP
jgi:tetratricopeptide (TPR) repeat protein